MPEPKELARKARTTLAQALSALQAPDVPDALLDIAEPVAKTMGVLHRIESGDEDLEHCEEALRTVREVLSALQSTEVDHDAVDAAMEGVAGSLSKLFALTRAVKAKQQAGIVDPQSERLTAALAAENPVSRLARPNQQPETKAHHPRPHAPEALRPTPFAQPAVQQAQLQEAARQAADQAAQRAAAAEAAAAQAAAQRAAAQHAATQQAAAEQAAAQAAAEQAAAQQAAAEQAAAQQAAAKRAAVAEQAAARQAAARAAAASARPTAAAPMPTPSGSGGLYEVGLATHSPSNFYHGLSGNVVDDGGLFVATYNLPELGKRVALRVIFPGDLELNMLAEVRWLREADAGEDVQPGFGAQLHGLTEEGEKLVYRYARNREPMFYDDER